MAANIEKEALEAFVEYTKAFRNLDPKAAASYFDLPSMMVVQGNVHAFNSESEVEHVYAQLMAGLPAQGYDRTDFTNLAARRLSDDVVVVTGDATWKKADGSDLNCAGITYTLHRRGDGWKNLCALIHDPGARP